MPGKKHTDTHPGGEQSHDPAGFTPHNSGLASEFAREQGWGTNQDERTRTPREKQAYDGGTDYDYGAQDFGDSPSDTSSAQAPAETKDQAEARAPAEADRKQKHSKRNKAA